MSKFQYAWLETPAQILELLEWHNARSKYVVIDTETTGLDPFKDDLLSVVISGRDANSACAFSGEHLGLLAKLTVRRLVLHNFKFDFNICYRKGLDLRTGHDWRDTMLLHHLLDENASHRLGDIVVERYKDNYKALFWAKYKTFESAPAAEQLEYQCKDVIYTDLLYRDMLLSLADEGVPESLIDRTHRLASALFDTELRGIRVDLDYLTAIGTELKPKINAYARDMRSMVEAQALSVEYDLWATQIDKHWSPRGNKWKTLPKPDFNFDSHRQLGSLLYDKLGLPEQKVKNKKTKQMTRTVDDDALGRIGSLHPVLPLIQEYRTWQKVYTAFIEGTLERMRDGYIHPSFNVNGTVTGRISSSDPNMQQLPSKGEWAKVRGIYLPDSGCRIISCDYSQLEVVIACHFSQDKNLLKIVREGASKHDITAAAVGIPRNVAKTLNFAMQYQCTWKKVKDIVGCSDKEAQYIWNKYWEAYAGEKRIIDECKLKVDRGDPIVNPFGRHRRFPTEYEQAWHKESAYRQAYSSLIQGTGADCTHGAFIHMAEWLSGAGYGRALFEVHDEIVVSAQMPYLQEVTNMLKCSMVEVGVEVGLSVPLSVECKEPLERWTK